MTKYAVMYNPLSDNGRGELNSRRLERLMPDDTFVFFDITKEDSLSDFFQSHSGHEKFILAGGDGTLNHFINGDYGDQEILYFACGSGNDFLHDVEDPGLGKPFPLNPYLKNLPSVTVKGKTSRFINGIGYGIDGYCCEEGDRRRKSSAKRVNYTSIALKGLFIDFRPRNAKITIDGKEYNYERVWMAPTMNGRYFGGGMKVTPEQDRLNPEGTVSLMVAHDLSRLKILYLFPFIFKGTHVSHPENVTVMTGKEIDVEFDDPCALQIDGETVTDVSSYHVSAGK